MNSITRPVFWTFQIVFAVIIMIMSMGWLLDGKVALNIPFIIIYVGIESVLWTLYCVFPGDDSALHYLIAFAAFDFVISLIVAIIYVAFAGSGNPDLAAVFLNTLQLTFWINVLALPVTGIMFYAASHGELE